MHADEQLIEDYLASVKQVKQAFAGMSQSAARAHPVEGKWSSLEVLCHLVDADLTISQRIRAALVVDGPRLPAFSREVLSTILVADARQLDEELALFSLIRTQTARILKALPPGALDRTVVLVKNDGDEVTKPIRQIISGITQHIGHHLGFVEEKRRALGLTAASANGR